MAENENSISKFLDEIGLGILWGKIKGLIYDEDGTNKFTKLATLIGINTTDISKRAYNADAEGATTTNSYVKRADSADMVDGKHASDFATATQGTNSDNHIANKNNPHEVTKAQIGLGNVTNDAQVKRTEMGVANGVATLDTDGKVPTSQLPSYVDDVVEYDSKSAFPATGEAGKIYVAKDTNLTYRWGGSAYVEISPTLALGETSSTAYRGDRGAVAYNHSQTAHAPSNAQKNVQSDWNVTDNTSDAYIKNKPNTIDADAEIIGSSHDLNTLWDGTIPAQRLVKYYKIVNAYGYPEHAPLRRYAIVTHEVTPLVNGLCEVHQRFEALAGYNSTGEGNLVGHVFTRKSFYYNNSITWSNWIEETNYNEIPSIINQLGLVEGKTALFLGDSITEGYLGGGLYDRENVWAKKLANKLNLTYYNTAVANATYVNQSAYPCILEQAQDSSIKGLKFDYIFIAAGINDFWKNLLAGFYNEAGLTSQNTICAGVNASLNYCINYKLKQGGHIIVISPINHGKHDYMVNIPTLYTIGEIRNKIAECCMNFKSVGYNVSYINGNDISFPNEQCDDTALERFFGDGLHPTIQGHEIYASKVYSIIKENSESITALTEAEINEICV